MSRAMTLLTGAGLGAGLMYFLDPQKGRRRRALMRDKIVRIGHEMQETTDVVRRDMRNRMQGLACGDLSVLMGGRRALHQPLRGSWSPAGRAILTLLGSGLFLAGLTRRFPTACILGTAGLAMIGEGITNAGINDIVEAPSKVACAASNLTERLAGNRGRRQRIGASDGRAPQIAKSPM